MATEVEILRSIVKDLEWSRAMYMTGMKTPDVTCPLCTHTKIEGHAMGCRIGVVLRMPDARDILEDASEEP